MDQLIRASLSHPHYWYEVGMLKVPISYVKNPARGHKVEKHHPEGKNVRRTRHTVDKRENGNETKNTPKKRHLQINKRKI